MGAADPSNNVLFASRCPLPAQHRSVYRHGLSRRIARGVAALAFRFDRTPRRRNEDPPRYARLAPEHKATAVARLVHETAGKPTNTTAIDNTR